MHCQTADKQTSMGGQDLGWNPLFSSYGHLLFAAAVLEQTDGLLVLVGIEDRAETVKLREGQIGRGLGT